MQKSIGAYITGLFGSNGRWNGDATAKAILASESNTYIFWAMHVDDKGNLFFNNVPLITNGTPNQSTTRPISDLISRARNTGRVQEVYFSVGGWMVPDFFNLENIFRENGAAFDNLNSNLAQLFELGVDGLDYDYEENNLADPVGTITALTSLINKSFSAKITYCRGGPSNSISLQPT